MIIDMESTTLISSLMDYLFILTFCLIGAIVKDTYNTLTEKEVKVKISRILLSTMVSSILIFSLSDFILSYLSWKLFILPCFAGGMVGFELLGKITKLNFWLTVINNRRDVIKRVIEEERKKEGS